MRLGRRCLSRFSLPFFGALIALLALVPAASASFHLMKVREVYPAGDASYVELQMFSAGEYLVAGHHLVTYNANGTVANDFSLPSNVSISSPNNSTVLIADSGYSAAFPSGPAADESDPNLNLSATGGAVCWTDGSPPDCVSWGNFTGPLPAHVPALVVGNPASPAGVSAGKALRRSIVPACPTLLEAGDDSDDSATDFSEVTPLPRANATAVSESPCVLPVATIDSKPANPTKATTAGFTFHSAPAGASFECKLDLEAFAACEASGISYPGPLSEGTHSFQVRAKSAAGTGAATSYGWRVDLTPPTATIDTPTPADPGPGKSASFFFHASETGSSFECSLALAGGPDSFSTCTSGKTYSNLPDGENVFKVVATDPAGNKGEATEFAWEVDHTLADTTPPQTTIETAPPDPSDSPVAAFTYSSNEPGSSFECALDAAGFSSCPAGGISYSVLANGPHSFQVRAIDPSANADPTPAGYSFGVSVPTLAGPTPGPAPGPAAAPQTILTAKPGAKTRDRTPTFRFRSDSPAAGFECALDGKPYRPCRSPFTAKSLKLGRHNLAVRAVLGPLPDPTPVRFGFKVVRGH